MQKRPFGLIISDVIMNEKTSRSRLCKDAVQIREKLAMTKGQQTRRDIVEKAAPLFNKKGFEGTSLSDLMHATGLQKGGIYRHFSSKEELATEVFDYAWQKAVSRRLEGIESSAN